MLGLMIKRQRLEKNLTLTELAARTGVSASFISQIERGVSEPSLSTLGKIASALGVSMFQFLPSERDDNPVVRRDERKRIAIPKSNVIYELLSSGSNKNMEMIQGRLLPGEVSSEEPLTHPCEECTLVLRGRLEVVLGERRYVLEEGDCIHFDSTIPHVLRNAGEEEVVFVSGSTPPVF